ncbi:ribosomal RNA small subunit methyltransferase E [Gottschalkia purinilytica]|uniref:Ribosomal RNA small subunit methyltransferase E n=1 Tax=Gottschalkia purinilytica TaxID=1503 RepID=A0A0L0W8S3_GOTPU|nr:16S rRNA (uracil(1498)-N(3))-methyltransferase [Gottschalkia purinilytica]KNF07944.1 ribosomal RNA small subunit methyltransferase E [Gottschalkia purinilytica]
MNLIILFESDYIEERKVRLTGRRFEHIISVHRASIGDRLRVGMLNGKIGEGYITQLNDNFLEMEISLTDNPPSPSNVQLILAMPRPKALKRIIQDVTTMGIKKIYIIKTWRVEKSFWSSPVLEEDNLFEHMILGLEQGKDTILPEIRIVKLFKPFVEDEIPVIIKNTRAIVGHPMSKKECPRDIEEPVTLAIGPEGGFIPYEIELLEKQGFESVSLGNRILRVETAIPFILGRFS